MPSKTALVSADRLERVSGLRVRKLGDTGAFHFSRDGGCSCDLMSDGADWHAPVWALEPDVLTGLAAALQLLHVKTGGFKFQALWIGDQPTTRDRIQLRDLLRHVRENRVRNKHVYLVGNVVGAVPQR